MTSLRSALIFIGGSGVAFGLLGVLILFTSQSNGAPAVDTVVSLVPGWSFIGTGLFAWWRRPNNRSGLLLAAIGFAWLLLPFTSSDYSVLFAIGLMTANVAWMLLVQLMLTFPGGRLETPWHRWLVVLFLVDGVLLPTVSTMFTGKDLSYDGCTRCPDNPLSIADVSWIATWTDRLATLGAVVLIGLLVITLIRRYRTLGPLNRDAIRPVLLTGALTLILVVVIVALSSMGVPKIIIQVLYVGAVIMLSAVPFGFLFGLLRSRFSSAGAVSELIATLGDSPAQDLDLRGALADALGDPTLQFAYWLPDRGVFVDGDGLEIAVSDRAPGRDWTPVEDEGELIAAIIFDDSLAENKQLIRATGSAAALALRNQRLDAELRANLDELRASRARIVQSSDAARRALERNLHDGAQQHLVSMALTLRMAQRKLDSDPTGAAELLERASDDLAEATTELRELARGIHPAVLTDRGLNAALHALAARSTVPVSLGPVPDERLPPAIESAAYFVVSEALTNVARYSEATEAIVRVEWRDGLASIAIQDDGIGGADINGGSGLRGLQDRVAALDGRLTITSMSGFGTTIRAEFPCGS